MSEPSLTLTIEEIRHLAQFCGLVIAEPTPKEKEDERETEIVVSPWPAQGLKGDNGMVQPCRYVANYYEYPEEGACPLGSPDKQSHD